MWINKIISFIIVVILILFGQIGTVITDGVLLSQYLGLRYVVKVAVSDPHLLRLSCGLMNVTRISDHSYHYNASLLIWSNGELFIQNTQGYILNNELHYKSDPAQKELLTSKIEVLSNGREFIIFPNDNASNRHFALLVSRTQSVSDITKFRFRQLSRDAQLSIVNIVHDNCDYHKQ